MKKIILTMCLAVVAMMSTTVSAKTFGWGVTAGMNVSKIDWENAKNLSKDDFDPENGWFVGATAMVSVPILGFGVDGSLIYSQEKISTGVDVEALHSFAIPVHLRYDFNLPAINKVVVPFVMAGPQFNYAMNDIDVTNMGLGEVKSKLKIENSTSWKLDIGLGAILLNHLQVSYGYCIPMGDAGKLKGSTEVAGVVINAAQNYKLGTHRIGVAYYF